MYVYVCVRERERESAGCAQAVREYSVAVSLSGDRLLHFSANCSNLCLFFIIFGGEGC